MSSNNEGGIYSKDYIRRRAEGSGNVDESGNFGIDVLRAALLERYNLTLANVCHEQVREKEITTFDGFVCHRNSHWFAIRKINQRYWNLDSTLDRPVGISYFRLAAEIDLLVASGCAVFCVVEGLLPLVSNGRIGIGRDDFWWKAEELIHERGINPSKGRRKTSEDPWKNAGSGMRLDGGSNDKILNVGSMNEDEMLQMALSISLEDEKFSGVSNDPNPDKYVEMKGDVNAEPLPEPSKDSSNTVRIRFRLPDGTSKVRRFVNTEIVGVLYFYAEKSLGGSGSSSRGRRMELRAGFPPRDLADVKGRTILEESLAGESVQCRYI